jgi:hypothetical protein
MKFESRRFWNFMSRMSREYLAPRRRSPPPPPHLLFFLVLKNLRVPRGRIVAILMMMSLAIRSTFRFRAGREKGKGG